jgi:hypothetical protein
VLFRRCAGQQVLRFAQDDKILGSGRYEWTLPTGEIMFGSHKVKIEGELLEKVKQCSDAAGYESIDEFVIHMLEKETKKILPDESSTSKEEIQKRLRGLGYIE